RHLVAAVALHDDVRRRRRRVDGFADVQVHGHHGPVDGAADRRLVQRLLGHGDVRRGRVDRLLVRGQVGGRRRRAAAGSPPGAVAAVAAGPATGLPVAPTPAPLPAPPRAPPGARGAGCSLAPALAGGGVVVAGAVVGGVVVGGGSFARCWSRSSSLFDAATRAFCLSRTVPWALCTAARAC